MKDEKTYVVYCHTCPNGMQYIGCTCNVKRRWVPSRYKTRNTPFKDVIERFGWDAITHEILYSNLTRDEALKIEDELICTANKNGTSLNVRRSGHYLQTDEFREEEKVRAKVYNKAYRGAHPEEYNAYMREYMREYRKRKKAEKEQAQQSDANVVKPTKPRQQVQKPLF